MNMLVFPGMVAAWIAAGGSVDGVVARIGDEQLFACQLEEKDDEAVAQLFDELVAAARARELGIHERPEVATKITQLSRQLAAEAFEGESFNQAASAEELWRFFQQNQDRVVAAMLQTTTREKADEAAAALAKGEPFEEVAKRFDISGGKPARSFSRREIPQGFQDAVFALAPGQISDVIDTGLGFAIVKLVSRSEAKRADFTPEIRETLRPKYEKGLATRMRDHFVERQMAARSIQIDMEFLESTGYALEVPDKQDHPVATVGDTPITYGDVIANHRQMFGNRSGSHASAPGVKRQVAEMMIAQVLVEQAALEAGFEEKPAVKREHAAQVRKLLANVMRAEVHAEVPQPTADQIESFYEANQERFRPPKQYVAAHILVATRELADQLRERIDDGDSFAELAKEFSMDKGSGQRGGELPAMDAAQLTAAGAAFRKTVLEIEPGTISTPVKSNFGFHLIEVVRVVVLPVPPLQEIGEQVQAAAIADAREAAWQSALAKLRVNAEVQLESATDGAHLPAWVKEKKSP